jgi:molybdopterin molybdotransferase
MIDFDAAVRIVAATARPLGVEKVAFVDAAARVLSADLTARADAPLRATSAMDGYAVHDADVQTLPVTLPVVAKIYAGQVPNAPLPRGFAARIFTGAMLPDGADRVIVQENCDAVGEGLRRAVHIVRPHGTARHIRAAGSDFRAGEVLLPAGTFLSPQAMVAAGAADVAMMPVWRRARVAVLSSGDELAEAGSAHLRAGAIPESVGPAVAAMALAAGATIVHRALVPDDLPTMQAAAGDALNRADVVIVTGGASVGEKDFARTAFAPLGLAMLIDKVAIKPGKPVWLARTNDGQLVLGLPGNPTSALVTARLFLLPLLYGLMGRDPVAAWMWRDLPLAAPLPATGDRVTFTRAISDGAALTPIRNQDSGAQRALALSNTLILCPAGRGAMAAGDAVTYLDF